MENTPYSHRLMALYSECLTEGQSSNALEGSRDSFDAATYLACYLTLKAIHHLDRSPSEERVSNFDILSVYHSFALLIYIYLTLPLREEGVTPDVMKAAVMIGKSLFFELPDDACVETIESGVRKFQLVGDAEQDYLMNYRQDLDKAVIAFVVVGTDENAPYGKEDVIPLFGSLLNVLCEAFEG